MKKVAVVTDSIACLTREQAIQYKIGIVPINILFENKVYRDWVDISPTEAYQLFLKNPDAFATSAPAPGECLTAFRQASASADNILCITVSEKLSSTYSVALMSKEYAIQEIPDVKIEVMDSCTATAAEGMIALAAAKAAENGADLDEVLQIARGIRDRLNTYVLLDTLRHVYRSGRIPKIASQAGTMLNIRPLFSVSAKVHLVGVVRSRERGIEVMFNKIRHKSGQSPLLIAVMHAYAPEAAAQLKDRLEKEFNCHDIWLTEFSPVMGYACGTGTLAVAFYSEA